MDRLANKITELEAENLQWKSLFRSSSIPEERVAILNLITANTNAITQLHASKSASLQGTNRIPSLHVPSDYWQYSLFANSMHIYLIYDIFDSYCCRF